MEHRQYYSLEYNHRDELCVVGNPDVYDREYDPIEVMPEIVLELLRIGLAYAKGQDYWPTRRSDLPLTSITTTFKAQKRT